jgi:hypothetical protein
MIGLATAGLMMGPGGVREGTRVSAIWAGSVRTIIGARRCQIEARKPLVRCDRYTPPHDPGWCFLLFSGS